MTPARACIAHASLAYSLALTPSCAAGDRNTSGAAEMNGSGRKRELLQRSIYRYKIYRYVPPSEVNSEVHVYAKEETILLCIPAN